MIHRHPFATKWRSFRGVGVGGLKVQEIFRRARAEEYRFPPHATLSAEIKDLITGMLKADPQQ